MASFLLELGATTLRDGEWEPRAGEMGQETRRAWVHGTYARAGWISAGLGRYPPWGASDRPTDPLVRVSGVTGSRQENGVRRDIIDQP